jgi:hypothetical protein
MAILTTYFTGQVGVEPNLVRLDAPEFKLSDVIAPNFLNNYPNAQTLTSGDFVFVNTSSGINILEVSKSGSSITLSPFVLSGNVAYTGNLNATIGNVPAFSSLSGNIQDGNVRAARILTAGFDNPDTNLNLIQFSSAGISASNLNSGPFTIFTPAAGKTYKLFQARSIGGSNFAGGGGDRNISISSNSLVMATIPAAIAQNFADLVFQAGDVATFTLALNYNAIISTANPLVVSYTAGSANYTSGAVTFDVVLERIS